MTYKDELMQEYETEIPGFHTETFKKALPNLNAWCKFLNQPAGTFRAVCIFEYAEKDGYAKDSTLIYVISKYAKFTPHPHGTLRRNVRLGNVEGLLSMNVEPATKAEMAEICAIIGK